jgi:hypothetical protein
MASEGAICDPISERDANWIQVSSRDSGMGMLALAGILE